jgi:tetratricopeptide (TPR) repeat protein
MRFRQQGVRALGLLLTACTLAACASTGKDDGPVVSAADESRARAHQSVGTTSLREGRIALAIRELRAAEQLNPQEKWIQLTLAEAYRQKGLLNDAETHLLKSLAIDPEFQSAHLTLSGLYVQLERYPEAVEHAQLLIDDPTFPKPWEPLTNKGYALMQLGNLGEARKALELAVDYHDHYWPAQLNLGILDAQEGRRLEAMERFDRVLDLGAGPLAAAEANFRLGEIYISLGDRERAVEHLVAASSQRPSGTWGKRSEDTLEKLR